MEHKDSMGNGSVITAGEVQVMSAGSGIMHSEYNPSKDEAVNLLQIYLCNHRSHVKTRAEPFAGSAIILWGIFSLIW